MFGFFYPIGIPELIIVLVVVLIIFGPGKLPNIGKAMGESIRNFRSSAKTSDENKPEDDDNSK